jgi:hypothetical protein
MNFAWNARIPRNIQGSFTCRKSTTWDQRLYFPSEGSRAEDFFALKNPTASAAFEPANLGIKGQHATPRPPKPLKLSSVLVPKPRGQSRLRYFYLAALHLFIHQYLLRNTQVLDSAHRTVFQDSNNSLSTVLAFTLRWKVRLPGQLDSSHSVILLTTRSQVNTLW